MKKKFVVRFISLLITLMLGFSFFPMQPTSAQPEEDPDFIVTLALMAAADDRLDGIMDLSTLSNLRVVVDDHYKQKSFLQMDADTAADLNHQKQVVLSALDKKINNEKTKAYRAQVGFFIALTDSVNPIFLQDPEFFGEPYSAFIRALSSNFVPDPEAVAMLQARLAANTQVSLQQNLDGHVADGVQNGRALVSQNPNTVYDFDAGKGVGQGGILSVQPRPLNFTNTGGKNVFVSVEYYQPPKGLSVAAPAMNVEVPGGNSIVMTGFPQGNYVFCVDWQTDLDTNGDGIKDYDRAVVRGWVSPSHPADPQTAQVIHVSPSFSETPIGRCGGFVGEAPSTEEAMTERAMTEDDPQFVATEPEVEETDEPYGDSGDPWGDNDGDDDYYQGADFWDQGDGDSPPPGNTLTTEEQAAQGGHAYSFICWEDGKGGTDEDYAYITVNFVNGGVQLSGTGGNQFYSRSSHNSYTQSDGSIIVFTSSGFRSKIWVSTETTSEGVEDQTFRHCTFQFND